MRKLFLIVIIFLFIIVNAQEKREKKIRKNIPDGYENIKWGTKLSKARDAIRGKLFFTDEKSIIISKEGELEYLYGFFYVDPAIERIESGKEAGDKNKEEADEGKLFYVSLKFPYLTLADVRKKIVDKYGASTNENLNDNQGAIAWNGDKTIIVMWVDRYEKKPYCRKITYVSKIITKELNAYQNKIFNKTEMELINKLNP